MTILALDLGKKVGWAANTPGGITSGVEDFSPQWSESAGMCLLRFKNWLERITTMAQITEIRYELVQGHRGSAPARVWDGFWSHLMSWCEEGAIPCAGVPVATIKRHATGKGNSAKTAMMNAATSKGWKFTDDNEADALWLLDYVLSGKK